MRLLPCPCAGAAARTSASKVAGRSLMRRPPGGNPFSPMLRRSDPASSNLNGSSPWHNPAPPAEYHPALIVDPRLDVERSEEHTSELQSRFGISYAVFCLKK